MEQIPPNQASEPIATHETENEHRTPESSREIAPAAARPGGPAPTREQENAILARRLESLAIAAAFADDELTEAAIARVWRALGLPRRSP